MNFKIDEVALLDEYGAMSAAELQLTARVARLFPGAWEAGMEGYENGRTEVVLFSSDKSAPAFSLFREGRFVMLTICRDHDAWLLGAFGSVHQALLAVAEAVLFWSTSTL